MVITMQRSAGLHSELLGIVKRGILRLVRVEAQDLDFYKYPADPQDHERSRQATAR